MRIVRIVLLVVLALVVIVALGGFIVFSDWTRGPLPQQNGELAIPGLIETVEILRDDWGIPHIYASNAHDLLFAQGYAQAQDRWWQMEFFRHVPAGRLGELIGKSEGLGPDRLFRSYGFREVAERELAESYDDEVVSYLQAFADGVNAYIMNRAPGDLALEYNVLGLIGTRIEIEPWTPVDTLLWGKFMAWNLSANEDNERTRSQVLEAVGQEMTDQWAPPWPFGEKPTIVQPEDLPISNASASASRNVSALPTTAADMDSVDAVLARWGFQRGGDIGSNNWVATGSMTETGLPLLANDPHLGIQLPSIWYEIGLHCQPVSDQCPFNVTGFTFSPSPGVVIGHNDRIAWGFTNVGADVQDYHMIRVNPDNPLQYEWNGEWRDMTVREEIINFPGGADPVTLQIRVTHLGPIVNDYELDEETNEPGGYNSENPMALRWTAFDPGTIFKAVMEINRASNWEQFRSAMQYFDVPSQNAVYADVEGNIGYQTPGSIPIRAAGHSGLVPIPGWTEEYEWLGFIPFENLPRIYNPERDYIATANQAVVPLEYYDQLAEQLADEFGADSNYVISQEWAWGYRGQRLVEMLETSAPHTIATFLSIQGDNNHVSAEEIMPYLADLEFDDAALTDARDWLLEWDFQMHMDSPQAALYAFFWRQLKQDLFDDQLPEDVSTEGSQAMWAIRLLLEDPENVWWDLAGPDDVVETRDDILSSAFREAYEGAVAALGEIRTEWSWGALHTATFVSNPLGASGIGPIEDMVNRGPVAASGSTEILNATGWRTDEGFEVVSLPSMRMIVDLSDWSQSVAINTTGESGHPYSPHYGDMIDLWRTIQYHPMLWTREQVEAAFTNRLVLTPGN
jgi:penicillin amidase